jgi:hypothetical protein
MERVSERDVAPRHALPASMFDLDAEPCQCNSTGISHSTLTTGDYWDGITAARGTSHPGRQLQGFGPDDTAGAVGLCFSLS